MNYNISNATHKDIAAMISLLKECVGAINSHDYSPEQIAAWQSRATEKRFCELWDKELIFMIAEDQNGTIVGFASFNDHGYIHSLFTHHDYLRRGIAARLIAEATNHAEQHNASELTTEASITAKPFFEHIGFITIKEQTVEIDDVSLTNYVMKKPLRR